MATSFKPQLGIKKQVSVLYNLCMTGRYKSCILYNHLTFYEQCKQFKYYSYLSLTAKGHETGERLILSHTSKVPMGRN